MKKEPHKKSFYVFKYLLGWIFLLWYRPKAVNKDYVPKDGSIVVCGNHIHILDQCIPLLKMPRMLHYMAKKEYFDGKFAWFFKAAGCISVNRQIHDEGAKSSAMELLNNGYGVGIFPEGTRNQVVCKEKELMEAYKLYEDEMPLKKFKNILKLNQVRLSQINLLKDLVSRKLITKDEYKESVLDTNLYLNKLLDKKLITKDEYMNSLMLPTKFGAVSMAQKTEAYVVPYVVTGKYKMFNNNLKITFIKPFKVSKDDSLEEKHDYLRNEMLKVLYEGNRIK